MKSLKKSDPLLKSASDASAPDEFDPVEVAGSSRTPSSRKEAAKARHMSLSQFAVIVNRDRNTVAKYLDQGMPFFTRADKSRGIEWVLDSAECIGWLEDRAATRTAGALTGDSSKIDIEEAKRRTAVAKMKSAEVEAAELLRMVARIDEMLALIKRDYAELRIRLMAIPSALAAKVEAKLSNKVREDATKLIKSALNVLKADEEIEKGNKKD